MLASYIAGIGFIGLIMTLIALYSARNDLVILTGLLGAFSWVLVAYNSFSVEFSTGTELVTRSYPALALFALALGVTAALPALTGPVEALNVTNDERTRY